jgi:hypothetical protein
MVVFNWEGFFKLSVVGIGQVSGGEKFIGDFTYYDRFRKFERD